MSHRWSHRAALHWIAAICPSPSAWQTLQMVAGRGASARRGDTGILQLDTAKSVGMEQAANFTRIKLLLLEQLLESSSFLS